MTKAVRARATAWRQVPNALSLVRIACAPVLLLLAVNGQERAFTWVLIPALLTDAVDGWLARRFCLQSRLGARLDSLGDALVWCAALAGLLAFQRDVLAAHRWLIGAVVACWVFESALALLRYRRLSSFHTLLSKLAGVLLTIYVAVLFVIGQCDWLLVVAATANVLASLEEIWLLRLLPQWRTDVKGIWWLRRERRARADLRDT